jgi:hypothetical protein
MNRRLRTSRSVSKSRSADIQLPQLKRVQKRTFTLVAAGDTDQDLVATDAAVGYIDLNQGDPGSVGKALVTAIYIRANTVVGTVAASVIGVSTATLGGGTVIVTPAALTGLTANGILKGTTLATAVAVVTTGKLYVYQTTDSANAGTIDVIVEYVDLSDLD